MSAASKIVFNSLNPEDPLPGESLSFPVGDSPDSDSRDFRPWLFRDCDTKVTFYSDGEAPDTEREKRKLPSFNGRRGAKSGEEFLASLPGLVSSSAFFQGDEEFSSLLGQKVREIYTLPHGSWRLAIHGEEPVCDQDFVYFSVGVYPIYYQRYPDEIREMCRTLLFVAEKKKSAPRNSHLCAIHSFDLLFSDVHLLADNGRLLFTGRDAEGVNVIQHFVVQNSPPQLQLHPAGPPLHVTKGLCRPLALGKVLVVRRESLSVREVGQDRLEVLFKVPNDSLVSTRSTEIHSDAFERIWILEHGNILKVFSPDLRLLAQCSSGDIPGKKDGEFLLTSFLLKPEPQWTGAGENQENFFQHPMILCSTFVSREAETSRTLYHGVNVE